MFLTITLRSPLEGKINKYFNTYRSKIFTALKNEWDEEDIDGNSDRKYTTNKYYLALYLAILIYREYSLGIKTDKNYYYSKYNLECVIKELACIGIKFKDVLATFEINFDEIVTEGINFMEIEDTFEIEKVEDAEIAIEQVDIEDLLDETGVCTNFYDLDVEEEESVIGISPSPPSPPPPSPSATETIYYGSSALTNLNAAQIQVLFSFLDNNCFNDFPIIGAGYKYVAIPIVLGIPSAFIDANTLLPIVMDTPYIVIINTLTYNVWRSYYSLGASIVVRSI